MESILKNALDIIIKKIDPDKIILFGSHSIDEYNADSDYDICILKKGVKHKRKLAQELYQVLYVTKLAVDIIVESPEKFAELKNNPFLIYHEIAATGKVLYEKS